MAERARFELAVGYNPYERLANAWFKPLTHLSMAVPCFHLARGEGFEPPVGCPTTVFKTVAFNHSANPPFWRGALSGFP